MKNTLGSSVSVTLFSSTEWPYLQSFRIAAP